MKVAVIGTGFVGVVTAAVFASFGNDVVGLDIDQKKIEQLQASTVPFFEPQLEDLLKETQEKKHLTFTTSYEEAIKDAKVIIIAVGTPSQANGEADLKYVFAACDSLAPFVSAGAVVVVKSTVPPGTLPQVTERIKAKTQAQFYTASVPEFLKEGTAVADTLHPDRVVIGVAEDEAFAVLQEMHMPLNAEIIRVAPESAQMGKYASNAYLALRITFANQIADLCEKNDADVEEVIKVMGRDKRIGTHYWYPGFGYGGSCFPKDVKELSHYAHSVGLTETLFTQMDAFNEKRIPQLIEKFGAEIGGWQGKKVAVLGVAFKPNTDDLREAPSLKVIPTLLAAGATVVGYDPKAIPVAQKVIAPHPALTLTENMAETLKDVDVVMALIEWQEIVTADYSSARVATKEQWFIDARNQFDPQKVTGWGFQYFGVGRILRKENR